MKQPLRIIGVGGFGQSNQQGAALTDNGGRGDKAVSVYTGQTEPFLGNVNGGGSMYPYLVDHGRARGVHYLIFNGCIGGAGIQHFTGIAGASVVGNPATPVALMNISGGGVGLSTSVGTSCVEGDVGWDPFSILSRFRTFKAQWPQVTEWVTFFANGESNGAMSATQYRDHQKAIANYMLASGVRRHFVGLSSSGGGANSATMNTLQLGVDMAIADMQAQGKAVSAGANLYKRFGMNVHQYPEASAPSIKVHLPLRGQEEQGKLLGDAFQAAGF